MQSNEPSVQYMESVEIYWESFDQGELQISTRE